MKSRNECSTHAFSVPLHVHCLVCFAWQTLKIFPIIRLLSPHLNIEFRSVDLHLEKIQVNWKLDDHSYKLLQFRSSKLYSTGSFSKKPDFCQELPKFRYFIRKFRTGKISIFQKLQKLRIL